MQTAHTVPSTPTVVPFTHELDRSRIARIVIRWTARPRLAAHDDLPADVELPAFATLGDIFSADAQLHAAARKLGVTITTEHVAELKDGADAFTLDDALEHSERASQLRRATGRPVGLVALPDNDPPLPAASLVVSGIDEAAQTLASGKQKSVAFTLRDRPTPDDVDAARPAKPAPSRSWDEQTVDAEAAARAKRDEDTLADLGIVAGPTMFALGTTMVQVGVDAARASVHEYDALPAADAAMVRLAAEVKAENRQDYAVGLAQLHMSVRGGLVRRSDPEAGIKGFELPAERDALRKLQGILRAGVGVEGDLGVVTALSVKDEAVVKAGAAMWNNYVRLYGAKEQATKERKNVVLRARDVERPSGERRRQVYAVVSESYGEVDVWRVADAVRQLPQVADCKAEVVYDRDAGRAVINVLTQTTVAPEDQCVGDVHRLIMRVSTDDTGGGSLRVSTVAERIACRNRTLVSAEGAVLIIRHLGETERLVARLAEGLRSAYKAVHVFAKQWGRAVAPLVVDEVEAAERKQRDDFARMIASFERDAHVEAGRRLMAGIHRSLLVEHKLVPVKRVEEALPQLYAAHYDPRNAMPGRDRVPGGLSRASLANDLTLWAQSQPWDRAPAIEELAGRIVSGEQPLTWLAAPAARA